MTRRSGAGQGEKEEKDKMEVKLSAHVSMKGKIKGEDKKCEETPEFKNLLGSVSKTCVK